ncbi:HK97 gp10 family phage protein [Rummeliibacillus sp. POC4]|uniref:HK97 gp10 family phage protein n=1 Tax=Rummeliibacillus sp. POC4 TaxID=2305899 RepID=UPI000E66ACA1|nr:HK97 gp10 family phage protein [Rummeliibacillus sp. POC4]RIJ65528.1 HK97 gp10 family phage protein [Rummeliibacillus sp. POC4]
MSMEMEGLTEFQNDLLEVAQKKLPKESLKIMRKVGSKARTKVARKARSIVHKQTGNYQKGFKRGKAFKDSEGKYVVRIINSQPHAHLIEYGHKQVTKDGRNIGFVPGKNILANGMAEFDSSGVYEKELLNWLDDLLESGDL